MGRKIQIRREKIFLTTPWSSTGLLVKNIDMTNPVLAQGEVQFFFLDGFEFYDQKLPWNDIFEGPICLDLPKSSPLNSKSNTGLGSDQKKKISQWIRILNYKSDQCGNFQCSDMIGSILKCGLLLKGSFTYYVTLYSGLFGPPTPLVTQNLFKIFRNPSSDPLPPKALRNM